MNFANKIMPNGNITLFFENPLDKEKLLIQHWNKIDYGI